MKKLLILSGKGGTGKTTTAASFIRFANAKAVADCDVDAPNLHLVTENDVKPREAEFLGAEKAWIDLNRCTGCGKCMEFCRFHAIEKKEGHCHISEFACEGCGLCEKVCPNGAIHMKEDVAGHMDLYKGDRVFSTAELKMGRGNSGKLVSEVKMRLFQAADDTEIAIIDGSPGIGCPVISSISGMDMVLIVAEPSVSGVNDLQRLLHTIEILQTEAVVCVNKWDISPEQTKRIEEICREKEILFAGKIPYDSHASEAINKGISLADIDCPARDALYEIYQKVREELL